jgi:hypothetical protein
MDSWGRFLLTKQRQIFMSLFASFKPHLGKKYSPNAFLLTLK